MPQLITFLLFALLLLLLLLLLPPPSPPPINQVKEQPLLGDLGLKLYKSEWKGISKVIQTLGELRSAEKEQSQKLDDALHSRELLASFSSKKTPTKSRSESQASISSSFADSKESGAELKE
mmetsp:Transcript_39503/g.64294  ORF Transcript_39503/g.64294 Transcript_39503/m.64294 type:complete len:121 (+) Transcript_39503:575-937(+)